MVVKETLLKLPLLVRQVRFVGAQDGDERRALQSADAGTHVEQVLVAGGRFHIGKPQRLEQGRAAGARAIGDFDADPGFLGRFHNSHEVSSFRSARSASWYLSKSTQLFDPENEKGHVMTNVSLTPGMECVYGNRRS